MKHDRTPRTHFANKSVVHDTPTDNLTYQLRDSWTITHCDRVDKCRPHTSMEGGDPTHISTARTGMPSANICSILPFQKGGYLLWRRAYRKEKSKDYFIVSESCNASAALYVPQDFFPDQAYLSFHKDKSNEARRQWDGSPHPLGLTGNHIRWQ